MAKGLTEKQRQILEYIIDFYAEKNFPPTIRELGDAFAIGSLRGVTVHLDALVRKGYITRDRSSRSIRLTGPDPRIEEMPPPPESLSRLPLVRSISSELLAGKAASEGQIERHLFIPDELAGPATENGFVIRVGASGVRNEPILPGDLLIVRPQRAAGPGDLVVTLSHGDMQVSRADDSPTLSDGPLLGENEVLGRVVGLVRRY